MLRHFLRQAIPSMFHRRLLLLLVLAFAVFGALALRAWVMTTGKTHAARKQQIEKRLVYTRYTPAKRGRILDRNGVVLAEDKPSWNVAVNYQILSGNWVKTEARKAALANPTWHESSDDERETLIQKYEEDYAHELTEFWKTLADAAHVDPQFLFEKQDAIVKKVSTLRTSQLNAKWEKKLTQNPEVSKDEDAWEKNSKSFALPEESANHVVLKDIDDSVRLVIQDILEKDEQFDSDEEESNAPKQELSLLQKMGFISVKVKKKSVVKISPWANVDLELVRARRYPCETTRLSFDRSTLPVPLKNDKPLDLIVRGIGMHVIGYTHQASEIRPKKEVLSELEAHPLHPKLENDTYGTDLHGLVRGDFVGAMGLEKSFEEVLRGTRGKIQISKSKTGLAKDERIEAVNGQDVQLALDIKLQAKVEAIMSKDVGLMEIHNEFQPWRDSTYFPPRGVNEKKNNEPWFKPKPKETYTDLGKGQLNGAALVVDVASGEIFSCVSAPNLSLIDLQNKISELWNDRINYPMTDRVLGHPLMPGSVMKPLILSAAISEGVYEPGEIVDIPPFPFLKFPKAYRDFYVVNPPYEPLGKNELAYAIALSSSPPFVMLAQTKEDRSGKPRLGPTRTLDWFKSFGFGIAPLPATSSGQLGFKGGATPDMHAELAAMGQGDAILATPLQIGQAYLRLLNQNTNAKVSLLKTGSIDLPPSAKNITNEAVSYVLKGMWMATHHMDYPVKPWRQGTFVKTGKFPDVFDCAGVKVWGKSGTAQVSPQRWNPDASKKPTGKDSIIRAGDHAWTVALCAPEGEATPRFIIITMLEYGGSGARAAGPIANQIIYALKAEGYLEKTPKVSGSLLVNNPDANGVIKEESDADDAGATNQEEMSQEKDDERDPADEGGVL